MIVIRQFSGHQCRSLPMTELKTKKLFHLITHTGVKQTVWSGPCRCYSYVAPSFTTEEKSFRTHNLKHLIPQRRVLLKELTEWVPWQSALNNLYYPPKGSSKNSLRGSHRLGTLYQFFQEKNFTPLRPTRNRPVYQLVGWAYLPFGTLDHVRAIFIQFLGL